MIVSQVELSADQDDGDAWSMVFDFWEPLDCGQSVVWSACEHNSREQRKGGWARPAYLGFDVIEGWRADDREADQEDVGLRIG